jgi:transposase
MIRPSLSSMIRSACCATWCSWVIRMIVRPSSERRSKISMISRVEVVSRLPVGLDIQQVRRTEQEALFNSLIEQYHYLGYEQPVGEHLKYLISSNGQVIAGLAWCSAARHLASRDRFIGWRAEARQRNLHLLVYNTRFLILPWVQVPHLASHILGRMAKLLPQDWQRLYAHPIYWLETFVDPTRFQGTCYRAANWIALGRTTGRGHNARTKKATQPVKELLGLPLTPRFRELLSRMKRARPHVDINLQELDQVLDQARQAPLSEPDYQKIKDTLHTLVELLTPVRNTEKTSAVLPELAEAVEQTAHTKTQPAKPGHGRNAAAAFNGARKVTVQHAELKSGDRCPDCEKGKVYLQKEPKPLVRIIGQPPLTATVYELERLRCNACGQVFTAQEPAEVGPDKYDETTGAMIAQLKCGSGVPFYRLEKLQDSLGIPLPGATQWEIVEEVAEMSKPALEELIRQAAQGEVLHNDDTSMRVLLHRASACG